MTKRYIYLLILISGSDPIKINQIPSIGQFLSFFSSYGSVNDLSDIDERRSSTEVWIGMRLSRLDLAESQGGLEVAGVIP